MRWPLAAALVFTFLAACGRGGESAQPEGVSGPGAYIALGDSLSEGVGASVQGESDFVSRVRDSLPGEFELLNMGESGDTSGDLIGHGHLEQAAREIESRREDDDPDNDVKLVTLEIGGNDLLDIYFSRVMTGACPALEGSLAEPECVGALRDALDGFSANLATAIEALQDADADADVQVIVMTLYDPFSGGLQTISELADLALEGKKGTPFPEGMNDIIREEAAKSGVTLVDWYPLFEGKAGEYISFDYIHPNDEGYRVMAEAVLDGVR
jgi:lysophospholipase L1-like esterase